MYFKKGNSDVCVSRQRFKLQMYRIEKILKIGILK